MPSGPALVHRDGVVVELPASGRWLRLQPGDRDLRLPAPSAPVRHRYWLQAHDAGWIELPPGQPRLYQQVLPGRHRLMWQVADAAGGWAPVRSLELLVEPVWWRTPSALLVAALVLLAGVAWLSAWHRARRARRQALLLSRERQALAEQHSEAKSRFLATLGHEIRTPMTGVLGMAELLQGSALDPRQRAQVDAIQRAGAHLLRLLNDALDLARIEAGRLRLENARFELRPLLQEVAGLLQPLASAKSLVFSLHCDAGAPVALHGDATRLRQVLFNLGHNAIKFCEQGKVSLRVGPRSPQGLVLEMRDTGPGLDAERQARLFHRFEPGDGDSSGGTGLGLAISQELVVAMGDRSVWPAPWGGACFRVELPLAAAEEGPLLAADEERLCLWQLLWESCLSRESRLRVFLFRDLVGRRRPPVAEVVVGLLQRAGHRVLHAPHGLAALTALETQSFDLALLDLDLPGIDGLALARLIRARGLELPLIALTARSDPEAEPAARAAGMGGFLRKPVTGEMLAGALAAVR
ncbi:ATP-binding protein [Arenimonas daejeonensis]|uniref:ATP-binding protein n=1 Tax=Arenimonas daejeonensis TaxID=370777 RepID=UPI001315697B|nr:ATP-binding protein [Arenimonas daejeonensis]